MPMGIMSLPKRGRGRPRKSNKITHTGGVKATIRETIPVGALATKGYVRKLVRKEIETKFFDKYTANGIGLPDPADASGSAFYILSAIPQGAGDSARDGDKCRVRALMLRGEVFGADSTNVLRLIVFQYKSNTSLHAVAVNELLQSLYVGTAYAPHAPYTHDYQNQFIVLYDRQIYTDTLSHPSVPFTIKVKLKYAKKQIAFTAGGTNGSNHIYFLCLSDSTAVQHPSIAFISRLWYDDA